MCVTRTRVEKKGGRRGEGGARLQLLVKVAVDHVPSPDVDGHVPRAAASLLTSLRASLLTSLRTSLRTSLHTSPHASLRASI